MENWFWAAIVLLLLIIAVLIGKIYLLKKAAKEIEEAFAERLGTDTNTTIDISTGDKTMRRLANAVNIQLVKLRSERHRYQQGDMELKNAVTNISHDLRTPLTAIRGYLDLLEQEEKSENVCRYIDIIRNRTDILNQLTAELFQYSVLVNTEEEMRMEPVILNQILEESIAGFYAVLKDHDMIPVISLPKTKVCRNLNPSALSRVFSNLLNNAVRYSDGDLEIVLTETGEITFSNLASGMDEVQAGKLFNRFYTVEAARKSTGLGLAITRTLVERMGGTATAACVGGRLCIRVVFPAENSFNSLTLK